MATFPALRPATRGFTAANYPGAVHAAYSGKEGRVRTSNAQTGARLRLQFAGLAEADMLSIASHYAGQRGRFIPFQLSTAVLAGMADPGAVTPTGYQWIYAGSPKITDISVGTPAAPSCVHDVELELELVPEVSALVGGANWIAQAVMAGGAADNGEILVPGAAWVATAAMAGGEALYDGSASGASWSAAAAIAGGAASDGIISAAARYWRVTALTVPSIGYFEISELGFYYYETQRTGTLTSATGPTSGTGLTPLQDGDLTTRSYWPKGDITSTWWITIDLGSSQSVNGIKQGGFDTSNRYMSGFTLQYSSDGSTWTTLGSASGLSYPGNNTLSSLITVS